MRFIKIHPNISSVMSSDEIAIFILLMEQDFYIKSGSSMGWSRDFIMKSTGLKRYRFKEAVDLLEAKNIIRVYTPAGSGMKNSYLLNNKEIDCLMRVLDKTNNKEFLKEFMSKIYSSGRLASNISDSEYVTVGESTKTWSERIKNNSIDISTIISANPPEENDDNSDIYEGEKSKIDLLLEKMEASIINQEKLINLGSVLARVCRSPTQSVQVTDTSIDISIDRKIIKNNGGSNIIDDETIFFPKKESKKEYEDFPHTLQIFENLDEDKNDDNPSRTKKDKTNDNLPRTKKDKTMNLLSLPENKYSVDSLKGYFEERYPEGSVELFDNASRFYDELVDELWWDNDSLSELSFLDVFRDFIVLDDKVFTFYNKMPHEALEVSIEELESFMSMEIKNKLDKNTINLPEDEKIKYIESRFLEAYSKTDSFELDEANNLVKSIMRDLNSPEIKKVKFNNPRLSAFILNYIIEPTNCDDQFFWHISKTEGKSSDMIKINNNNLEYKTEPDDVSFLLSPELSNDNIYIDIFDRFRITRRMNVDNIDEMVRLMLVFARIESGVSIRMDDLSKLIYGLANKLGKNTEEVYNSSKDIFLKSKIDDGEFIVSYE